MRWCSVLVRVCAKDNATAATVRSDAAAAERIALHLDRKRTMW